MLLRFNGLSDWGEAGTGGALYIGMMSEGNKMMNQFVVWSLRGVSYICLRDDNDPYFLVRLARVGG